MTKKDYSNSKIYKIEPIVEHNEEEIYIGSTTKQYLSQRMTAHKYDYTQYKKWKKRSCIASYKLFDKYGVDNCRIVLLENVNACTNDELKARETFYINSNSCINKRLELRESIERYNIYQTRKKQPYICECKANICITEKARHFRSKKHLKYLDSINGRSAITPETIL